jgi:hypothetical protein
MGLMEDKYGSCLGGSVLSLPRLHFCPCLARREFVPFLQEFMLTLAGFLFQVTAVENTNFVCLYRGMFRGICDRALLYRVAHSTADCHDVSVGRAVLAVIRKLQWSFYRRDLTCFGQVMRKLTFP